MNYDNEKDVIEGELVDPSEVPANLQKFAGADVGNPSNHAYPQQKPPAFTRVSHFQFSKLSLPVAVIAGAAIIGMGVAGLLSQILGLAFAAFVIWTVFRFADRTVNRKLQYKERRWARQHGEDREDPDDLEDDLEDLIRRSVMRKLRKKFRE